MYSGWPACKKEKMGAALVGFCERELLRLPARGESEGAERGLSFLKGRGQLASGFFFLTEGSERPREEKVLFFAKKRGGWLCLGSHQRKRGALVGQREKEAKNSKGGR